MDPRNGDHLGRVRIAPWSDFRIQYHRLKGPGDAEIALGPSYAVMPYNLVSRDGDVQWGCWASIEESWGGRAANYRHLAWMTSDRRGQANQTAMSYDPQVGKVLWSLAQMQLDEQVPRYGGEPKIFKQLH